MHQLNDEFNDFYQLLQTSVESFSSDLSQHNTNNNLQCEDTTFEESSSLHFQVLVSTFRNWICTEQVNVKLQIDLILLFCNGPLKIFVECWGRRFTLNRVSIHCIYQILNAIQSVKKRNTDDTQHNNDASQSLQQQILTSFKSFKLFSLGFQVLQFFLQREDKEVELCNLVQHQLVDYAFLLDCNDKEDLLEFEKDQNQYIVGIPTETVGMLTVLRQPTKISQRSPLVKLQQLVIVMLFGSLLAQDK